MTQEDKELLLKDISARLPYDIMVSIPYPTLIIGKKSKKVDISLISIDLADDTCTVGDPYGKTSGLKIFNRKGELLCKPYLRSMSNMTKEEKDELHSIIDKETEIILEQLKTDDCGIDEGKYHFNFDNELDFCLRHHFDYHNLIGKGLALEAPEGMYNK